MVLKSYRTFDVSQLQPAPDLVVIGNAMKRGNPCVESMLENSLPIVQVHNGYTSIYYVIAGCLPYREHMAKQQQPVC